MDLWHLNNIKVILWTLNYVDSVPYYCIDSILCTIEPTIKKNLILEFPKKHDQTDLEIIFLEPSDKMSNGIVINVGHDWSLFSIFSIKRFSKWFDKNLSWIFPGYNCKALTFYW